MKIYKIKARWQAAWLAAHHQQSTKGEDHANQ